ncbi:MAG: ComEC/Rec2 family competence protein [Rickettsiaceae bacterium]|nr:ComEC/Rec2 family competence protein [Rickettsiaceae bacterium]
MNISFKYFYRKLEEEYHHLSLWYFVSFIFGIVYFFQNVSEFSFYSSLAVVIPLFILAIYLRNKNLLLFFASACCLSFFIGFFVGSFQTFLVETKPIEKVIIADVTGEVIGIKPSLRGTQITLGNVKIDNDNLSKVRINISQKLATDLDYGATVKLRAKLFPLSSSVLPGTFDFGFYMYMSGIEASGYALTIPTISSKSNNSFSTYIQVLRTKIYHRLMEVMGSREGNFAAAILIGETKAMPMDIAKNMRDSGVAHILSVSGLHLSLVAMLFFISSRALLNCSNFFAYNTNVKVIAAIISIVGSFAYLHISGANIAATRAFIMTTIFIVSTIWGRSPYPLRSVMIAAFLILLFLPQYVLHPSFQLSFAAVLCLISGYEFYIKNKSILGNSKGIIASIKLYIFANIYSSFLASIMTAPYVIYHFYKFANYSVLMNLIAVPMMSFFMMPLALLASILMPIGMDGPVLKLLSYFISIVIDSAEFIVKLPWSVWSVGHIPPMGLVVFTIGFFWISLWQTRWRLIGFIIILCSLLIMNFSSKPDFIYDHNLKIIAIKDNDGQFQIFSEETIPGFTADYWTSWLGQKQAKMSTMPLSKADLLFKLANGKTVSINYWHCLDADVSITTSKKLRCDSTNQVINNSELVAYKQIMLYCTIDKMCKVQFGKKRSW